MVRNNADWELNLMKESEMDLSPGKKRSRSHNTDKNVIKPYLPECDYFSCLLLGILEVVIVCGPNTNFTAWTFPDQINLISAVKQCIWCDLGWFIALCRSAHYFHHWSGFNVHQSANTLIQYHLVVVVLWCTGTALECKCWPVLTGDRTPSEMTPVHCNIKIIWKLFCWGILYVCYYYITYIKKKYIWYFNHTQPKTFKDTISIRERSI